MSSLAKFAVRRYLGTGGKIFSATDCTYFFQDKFKEKSNPSFVIKEITQEALAQLKKYPTINGSDWFHVMVFKLNGESFRAAFYLCSCDKYLFNYASYDLFSSF